MREIYTTMREHPDGEYPITIHLDESNSVLGMSYGEEEKVGEIGYLQVSQIDKAGNEILHYEERMITQSIKTRILGILCFDTYRYSECMVVENGIGINKKFCKNPDNIRPWELVLEELQKIVDVLL